MSEFCESRRQRNGWASDGDTFSAGMRGGAAAEDALGQDGELVTLEGITIRTAIILSPVSTHSS
jgi:hypothetical protein